MVNFTCNSTLEDLRITSETILVGNLDFHDLGLVIAGGCAIISMLFSFYLIMMHALNYTRPYEQRHIIRILLMIPVYSAASFLSFWFYWHAIYYTVISACWEAFAIASFYALMCHYIGPNLHEQKEYFRALHPIRPWVLPISWFSRCCGGQRGAWRTPRSGLTWFNIIYAGIYQYCFIRVAATITAVVTQYFGVYCESSAYPWFAHIWVLVIEASSVTVAMYCVIQFYVQLRVHLGPHKPFLKVAAIKLVIFFSFWQAFLIAILTSPTLHIIHASDAVAYPDIAVGIPALLTCVEMAGFAFMHVFAYPWKPYKPGSYVYSYPTSKDTPPGLSDTVVGPKQGGPFGLKALLDALNPWDLVKGFARGMRWIFVGRRRREQDPSYKTTPNDLSLEPTRTSDTSYKGPSGLPIADEFRRSKLGLDPFSNDTIPDEGAGLMQHAQPNPYNGTGTGTGTSSPRYNPARDHYGSHASDTPNATPSGTIGAASSTHEDEDPAWRSEGVQGSVRAERPRIVDEAMRSAHGGLWGPDRRREEVRSEVGQIEGRPEDSGWIR